MTHQQQFSDTTVHTVEGKPFHNGLVSGNALSPLPCELIKKYWQIVKAPNHSPYFLTKKEENQSIIIKIKELQKIK